MTFTKHPLLLWKLQHQRTIATGYTDLRRGLEGLASIIHFRVHLDPYDRSPCSFFVASEQTVSKDLLWEGDGFPLL